MHKFLNILIFVLLSVNLFAQARLVINNDAFIVMDNGIYLVIDNSNTNSITVMGSGGNIISEDETNRVKWNIGTSNGVTYTVPFTDNDAGFSKIPVSLAITTAGTGSGNIQFSTYDGSDWDNSAYMPTGVTNVSDESGDNSDGVIDRFWIIDALGYTSRPAATLSFTYVDAEHSAAGNNIDEVDLQAQRWHTADLTWSNYGPEGTVNTGTNVVSSVVVPLTEFYRSWTLVDKNTPLPVELILFTGKCDNKSIVFEWATATEINNDFFVLEKSNDGSFFYELDRIQGSGNSNEVIHYSYTDGFPDNSYYRLKQVDYNGRTAYSDILFPDCSGIFEQETAPSIFVINRDEHIDVFLMDYTTGDLASVYLYDMTGKLLNSDKIIISYSEQAININTSHLRPAVYNLVVQSGQQVNTTKVFIR